MQLWSKEMLRTFVSFVAAGCLSGLTAGSTSIGMVRSNGEFRVDGSAVRGNATLFDGNLVETTTARSVLQLGGVQITLAPESRVKVFRDHIEAGVLRIASAGEDVAMQVATTGPHGVAIAARAGTVEVHNSAGALVAIVQPGGALALDSQAGGNTAFKMTGVVELKDGKYFLTDTTANVTVELQGTNLAQYVGKTVEVTGSTIPGATAAGGASEVVQVVTIKVTGGVGRGAGAGLSKGATVTIIGGVAVGGTLAGLFASGTFSSTPSLSVQ